MTVRDLTGSDGKRARMEEKEKTEMVQSDSISRVTPSELAALASRIDPEGCVHDPSKAIAAAERLLTEARYRCDRAKAEQRKDEEESEAHDKELTDTQVNWVRGIKDITGECRRDRAATRFREFLQHKAPASAKANVSHYEREGFTLDEVFELEHHFANWKRQPKCKKGNQGRRISKHDGRLRTELLKLVPRKPRKPT